MVLVEGERTEAGKKVVEVGDEVEFRLAEPEALLRQAGTVAEHEAWDLPVAGLGRVRRPCAVENQGHAWVEGVTAVLGRSVGVGAESTNAEHKPGERSETHGNPP